MRFILAALSMGLTAYMLANPVQGEPGTYLAIPAFLAPLAIGALSAGADAIFGGGGDETTQALDPATQAFLENQVRPNAQRTGDLLSGGVTGDMLNFGPDSFQQFLDPFQQSVIDAANADFDRSASEAGLSARQDARLSGSGRGSRGAVLQARREGEVERLRASTISGLRSQGFADANQRALAAAGHNVGRLGASNTALSHGFGPGQGTTTTSGGSNPIGTGLSAGLFAAGALGGTGPANAGSLSITPQARPQLRTDPNLFAGASLTQDQGDPFLNPFGR